MTGAQAEMYTLPKYTLARHYTGLVLVYAAVGLTLISDVSVKVSSLAWWVGIISPPRECEVTKSWSTSNAWIHNMSDYLTKSQRCKTVSIKLELITNPNVHFVKKHTIKFCYVLHKNWVLDNFGWQLWCSDWIWLGIAKAAETHCSCCSLECQHIALHFTL